MKIGYARVSTPDQNPALQLEALEKAGCEKIYQEKKSAFKERPELIRTNVDLIMNKGAHLVDVTHNIDTSTPSGKLLIPIFSMLAEIDQVLRTERTVAGWEVAKREGRTGGRKPGLNDLAKKKAEQAKKMYLSKDPFYSAKEIASILNISTRTLYKYLRSVGVEPKQNQ